MKLIRLIVKIILLPMAVVLTLVQWIGIFLNSISGMVMGILSFLFVLASGAEFLKMMIAAFVIFLIPHIGNWVVERIAVLRLLIGDFIRS
ncbi:MAG: hypothetical protein K6F23_03055 [Solobacterium sp.]|nr:hypothetical protein [Solobacterium sp.]